MVLIKLTGTEEEMDAIFYAMITNGNTSSIKLNEFNISDKLLEVIKEKNCKFETLEE